MYSHSLQTRAENVPHPDQLAKAADKFLVQSLSSDVSLLYPPSQVRQRVCAISCESADSAYCNWEMHTYLLYIYTAMYIRIVM